MPATGKVSLIRQTIYCFIPILDLYAAYHIKKLRWYLLILISSGIILGTITSFVVPQEYEYDLDRLMSVDGQLNWQYAILGENPETAIASIVVNQGITLAIAVYVIRRWSNHWNLQFD